ncbi:hypothetical protein K438DRAFT_104208 [Mycena galopus ATCC 62051]|nr:hypothetical protein K438DRAFT_104208 [Mycena galopus ATCC 62051]
MDSQHPVSFTELFQCVIEQDIIRAPAPFALDALPVAPGPSDQCIRSVTYEFSSVRSSSSSRTTTAPLPAFHPPPLASEPRLAPDFPAVGYGFNTSRQAPIPMESTGCMSQAAPLPLPLYRPPSPSTKYTSPSEQVFYAPDGSLVATPTPTPFGSISSSTGAFLYNAVASALPMPSSSYANYPYSYPSCPPSSLPSDEDIINAPYDYYDYDFQQPQPHPNSNQAYTYDTSYTYDHPYPTPYSIPATTYNPTAETSFWSQYCSLEQQNSNTDSF